MLDVLRRTRHGASVEPEPVRGAREPLVLMQDTSDQ